MYLGKLKYYLHKLNRNLENYVGIVWNIWNYIDDTIRHVRHSNKDSDELLINATMICNINKLLEIWNNNLVTIAHRLED